MTVILLAVGTVLYLAHEGRNPATLGSLAPRGGRAERLSPPRSWRAQAGFNVVDIGALTDESLFTTDLLMLIGGGSAGTAGGLKVTTIGVLAFVVWAEIPRARGRRGRAAADPDDEPAGRARRRRPGPDRCRTGSFALLEFSTADFDAVVFEAVSAFATVGLSQAGCAQAAATSSRPVR